MKYLILVLLFFIGCNNSNPVSNERITTKDGKYFPLYKFIGDWYGETQIRQIRVINDTPIVVVDCFRSAQVTITEDTVYYTIIENRDTANTKYIKQKIKIHTDTNVIYVGMYNIYYVNLPYYTYLHDDYTSINLQRVK